MQRLQPVASAPSPQTLFRAVAIPDWHAAAQSGKGLKIAARPPAPTERKTLTARTVNKDEGNGEPAPPQKQARNRQAQLAKLEGGTQGHKQVIPMQRRDFSLPWNKLRQSTGTSNVGNAGLPKTDFSLWQRDRIIQSHSRTMERRAIHDSRIPPTPHSRIRPCRSLQWAHACSSIDEHSGTQDPNTDAWQTKVVAQHQRRV